MKITFLGAGSTVFARNVIGDCMCSEVLRDSVFSLYDIDAERLEQSKVILEKMREAMGGYGKIECYCGEETRKDALRNATFVVNAIQVGGYDPCTVIDFEIPKKYGLRQTIGDTLGIGGIMRALRTIPVMESFARDIEEVCPDAWFLNYTNPMGMLTGYMQRYTKVKTIGLCHSVQVCVKELFNELGMEDKIEGHKELIAGINHMGWLLEIKDKDGVDLYPEIKSKIDEKLADPEFKDKVRLDYIKNFGYYCTESSEHNAEYNMFYIKSKYPELIEKYNIPLDEYPARCVIQINDWKEEYQALLEGGVGVHEQSREYASHIMEAFVTDNGYKIGANVLNTGHLISNFPENACVEVPCLVDGMGIHPCYVGELPVQCAAMNMTNINVQLLTIEAAHTKKREHVYVRNPEYRKVYGDLRAKQAGSSAFLHNKKGAMCEMFAATNWGASPTELREIASWQIMQGITFIVPHAYHHRLLGETKYFAPPIYSPHSTLNYSARQLNDTLATYCYYASLGTLKAPIAVLDVTDDIWEGRADGAAYFAVCEQLNRMPYGYVLADAKSIVNKKEAFSVIINAGAPLTGEREKVLSELNIPIIEPKELHKLSEFIDCKVSYEGEGMPHFMRRQLDSGEELVILANIEDDKAIHGNLTVGDTTYAVTLQTGEMAFFTERDRIATLTQLEACSEEVQLSDHASVLWGSENILPLEYWKDENGNPICKTADERYFTFTYNVKDTEVTDLKLMLPKGITEKITEICMDGKVLTSPSETRVFDEAYLSYDLADFVCVGEHKLIMSTQEALTDAERIFLQGEFGVDVSCDGEYAQMYATQYSLDKYIPEYAQVTLRKRPAELSLRQSWTEQGHPFYSGTATYCLQVELPTDFGDAVLSISEVNDGCIVTKDGVEIGNQALQPYIFDLGDMGGTHTLHLNVYNSMANAMECYREPSGITAGVLIGKRLVNQ